MRALDLGFAVVWLLLGLAVAAESLRLGLFGMFGPDRGFFPFLAGLLMAGAAAALMVSKASRVPAGARFWHAPGSGRRVVTIAVLLAALVAAIPHLGFVLAGALVMPVMIRLVAEATWLLAALIGAGATLLIHILFVKLLQQPLPEGLLTGVI